MIVQPDFTEHWKTLLLVEITKDASAPLAVIRLWGYCQTSKRSQFPDMTQAQLASVCRWGNRKPQCHIALMRCKFVEKLSPKGFKVHQWDEYNARLIANWVNGKLPKKNANPEIANEMASKTEAMAQPNPSQREAIEQNRTEQNR